MMEELRHKRFLELLLGHKSSIILFLDPMDMLSLLSKMGAEGRPQNMLVRSALEVL